MLEGDPRSLNGTKVALRVAGGESAKKTAFNPFCPGRIVRSGFLGAASI